MKNWKYTVTFKDLLSNDNDQSKANPIGLSIALRLKAFSEKYEFVNDDYEFEEILECIANINTVEQWESLSEEDSSWSDNPPISELNEWLRQLYDWCDNNRVWVK